MRTRHPGHRAMAAGAALLVVMLTGAPSVLAEPRERWPGEEARPGTPEQPAPRDAPEPLADLLRGECNAARWGAIAGAAIGGLIASRIGEGDGGTLATAAGALIGALIGGGIGRGLDSGDERCVTPLPPVEESVVPATGRHSA